MRRLTSLVVSVAVGFASVLVIPANPAGAAQTGDTPETDGSDVLITRYGGADRYATSLLIAEAVAAEAGGSLEWVVLVSGERWTDAVVAAPLAGALGAPVLMTPPGELRSDALEFLQRVGVSGALVVGPDAAGGAHGPGRGISAAVLGALDDAGVSVERVAGSDPLQHRGRRCQPSHSGRDAGAGPHGDRGQRRGVRRCVGGRAVCCAWRPSGAADPPDELHPMWPATWPRTASSMSC